jgi:hypothetical protein
MHTSRYRLAPIIALATIAAFLLATVIGVGLAVPTAKTHSNLSTSASQTSVCRQAMIPLGVAGHFRVLAATTVTNTGATVVNGNLGLSPGSAITGFPPGKVTGTIHKTDTYAARGQLALGIAFNNGMGRTNCPVSVAGNIGGKTLGPGLYKSTSSLMISSGDLTLSAHGHSKAVFIFQVATKFTMTSGRHVILAGGAQASHVFWIVGSSATLGTTSVLYGSILAHKSISLATGATVHGHLLAHIGAVTLAGNHVTLVSQGGLSRVHHAQPLLATTRVV